MQTLGKVYYNACFVAVQAVSMTTAADIADAASKQDDDANTTDFSQFGISLISMLK